MNIEKLKLDKETHNLFSSVKREIESNNILSTYYKLWDIDDEILYNSCHKLLQSLDLCFTMSENYDGRLEGEFQLLETDEKIYLLISYSCVIWCCLDDVIELPISKEEFNVDNLTDYIKLIKL